MNILNLLQVAILRLFKWFTGNAGASFVGSEDEHKDILKQDTRSHAKRVEYAINKFDSDLAEIEKSVSKEQSSDSNSTMDEAIDSLQSALEKTKTCKK